MNFKRFYKNGDLRILGSKNLYGKWNNLMLWLTRLTTFDTDYNVDYYPYMGERVLEKIECWRDKPIFWFFTRKRGMQYTRSTFTHGNKKEI